MDTGIIVYGTTWCSDCWRAKKVFDQKGVDYQWVDINQDAEGRTYVEQVNKGMRIVPTIVFPDGSTLVEPSNIELANKLDQPN